ncbi:hypothetical protein HMPREF1080_01482 [Bacteroides fragilis CL05T12C13]|uniref:BioF2-like acetyltransferase domain-containing protein n=2 Tax=Bacteroides fragilis TaxID=817 RepID=I9VWS1_BACFG|nr:hypothetical protein HMPREF1080_01482 [Bacteroides fragilis CL05T12C13]
MCAIEVYTLEQSVMWKDIVEKFRFCDVYYLPEYVKAFEIHGDGCPLLIYYKSDTLCGINVVVRRDIADIPFFSQFIQHNKYFDYITPYGYGGWLFSGGITEDNISVFYIEYKKFCELNNIICEFIRFHPLVHNVNYLRNYIEIVDLGDTISLNLDSQELIWNNMTSKNRNVIKKAQKNGVKIYSSKDVSLIDDFMKIYNATMIRDSANKYYYFSRDFYESIFRDLKNNFDLFYAKYEDKIIAVSIIIYYGEYVHYHLSGSLFEYRYLAPTNLLLYEVACRFCDLGYKKFHLGGGVGSGNDNLYRFKKSFNRNFTNQYSIGKIIYDMAFYNQLVTFCKDYDSNFNMESSFFPLYRNLNI